MQGVIFKATQNGKSYIGYSMVNKPPIQAANEVIYKSKYLQGKFDIKILNRYQGIDKKKLRAFLSLKRSEFVKKYGTLEPNGFNVVSKGVISDRYKKEISGKNSPWFGITGERHPKTGVELSPETKKKISEKRKYGK